MKIYTRCGDRGETSLADGTRVSKSDERIELLGTLDELSSFIGMAKPLCGDELKAKLSQIQKELMQIMAAIANVGTTALAVKEQQIEALEQEIDRLGGLYTSPINFVLYGGSELSARLDVARSVARRAERIFCKTMPHISLDLLFLRYLNRLSDYLYAAARYSDSLAEV